MKKNNHDLNCEIGYFNFIVMLKTKISIQLVIL
jgi:hypothetical protein